MQRRNIVDFRRQARSGLGAGVGGGAPVFAGVIDNVIAAGGAAPRHASSSSHRLYSGYTGPLIRVRRASDSAQADIGYDVATDRLDTAALAAHCGASNGFIVTRYDQSGNANDVTQATTSVQSKIYDGATGVLLRGTLPWITSTVTNGGYARGDSIGITGSPGVTHVYFGANANVTTRQCMLCVGNVSVPAASLASGTEITTGDPISYMAGTTRHRAFTEATAVTSTSLLVYRLAAGATIGASTCRQDGVDLVESAVNTGTATLTVGNVSYSVQCREAFTSAFVGGNCFAATWGEHLTGAALTALEDFGALLRTLD